MTNEAEGWHRLAPLALVFLIVTGIQRFVRENLFLFAGAGVGLAFLDWMGPRELGLALLAVLLIIVAGAMIHHRRFRFRLDDEAVRVQRGLFEKKELKLRFERVQNIQIGQPFYFKPFGLVRFSLETPGAAEKEVELPGIPAALAAEMRDRIAGRRSASGQDQNQPTDTAERGIDTALFAAGGGRLFVHGMSSNQVWVIFGAVAYLFGNLSRRIIDSFDDWGLLEPTLGRLGSAGTLLLVLVAAVGSVLLLSGLIAVLRFHGFRLQRRGERLVATGGLLDRREQTVARDKITGLSLRQSAPGRLWGAWYALVRQTSSSDDNPMEVRQGFVVPGLRREDLGLVGHFRSGWRMPSRFTPINQRFREFFALRWLLLCGLGLGLAIYLLGRDHLLVLAVGVVLGLGTLAVYLRFKHWGYALDGSHIWVRSGLLGRQFDVVELERVQQVQVLQSPYQRRHQIASLSLVLPQGQVSIPFIDLDTAAELANQALYIAETAVGNGV